MKPILTAAAVLLFPAMAVAQDATGDAAAGEEHFNRQCVACHVVADETGEVLAGRNARTGPNLYGVIGAQPAHDPEFDYSESMVAYGETGVIWEEANFVSYVQDPTGHLREALGDDRARSKMAYRVRDEQEALDIYAYLATFSPAPEAGAEGEAAGGEAAPAEGEAAPAEGEAATE